MPVPPHKSWRSAALHTVALTIVSMLPWHTYETEIVSPASHAAPHTLAPILLTRMGPSMRRETRLRWYEETRERKKKICKRQTIWSMSIAVHITTPIT